MGWSEEIYPCLEYEILSRLRFKTELVSSSQVVYELASVFFAQKADEEADLHTPTTDYASLN